VTYDEIQKDQSLVPDINSKAYTIQKFYKAYRVLKFIKACARLYRKRREECEKLKEEKTLELRYIQKYFNVIKIL
jgi:hypothetical protein